MPLAPRLFDITPFQYSHCIQTKAAKHDQLNAFVLHMCNALSCCIVQQWVRFIFKKKTIGRYTLQSLIPPPPPNVD